LLFDCDPAGCRATVAGPRKSTPLTLAAAPCPDHSASPGAPTEIPSEPRRKNWSPALFHQVDTRNADAVQHEVAAVHAALFPRGDRGFVARAFGWARDCFEGRNPGYLPIDARYHDLEHTLQGTLAIAQLLQGRQAAGAQPPVTAGEFQLGVLAALFHDTGYLKRSDDTEGTGAKYTAVHVERSAAFAGEFLGARGFSGDEVSAIQNMIRCTGVQADVRVLRFRNETERAIGYALGTADLLGQMAADDYPEKLLALYDEFAEAAKFPGAPLPAGLRFESADALMRSTRGFWENFVLPKINDDLGGLHVFLNDPYPDGPNSFVQRIERNLQRVQRELAAKTAA